MCPVTSISSTSVAPWDLGHFQTGRPPFQKGPQNTLPTASGWGSNWDFSSKLFATWIPWPMTFLCPPAPRVPAVLPLQQLCCFLASQDDLHFAHLLLQTINQPFFSRNSHSFSGETVVEATIWVSLLLSLCDGQSSEILLKIKTP